MQKLIASYETNTPYSPDYLAARRPERRSFPTRRVLAYGAAVLAAVGGYIGINKLTAPKPVTVTEIVQPYQAPWTIAEEAIHDAGRSSDTPIVPVVDQIVKDYGNTLTVGEHIKVKFK